jgi:hypothetical protein
MYNIEYALNFDMEIDPYRRSTGGQTVPAMCLIVNNDTETIRVVVEQNRPGETGVWTDELLYVDVTLPDETPDANEFDIYIHADAANALLQRIAAGYSWEWSGRQPGDGNRVAVLDEDAQAALGELEAAIADMASSKIAWWNIADWFAQTSWGSLTAVEVDDLIAKPVEPGSDDRLTEDPTDYIMEQFTESLQDELERESVNGDLLLARGAAVLQVLEVVLPAGNRWQHSSRQRPTDLITQGEAARLADVTPQAVGNAIRDGRLRSYRITDAPRHRPGGWLVSLDQVRRVWPGEE